jgi:hypothetical protein
MILRYCLSTLFIASLEQQIVFSASVVDPETKTTQKNRKRLIPDPDPGFDDLKLRKIYSWKFNFYILDQKLQFTNP